MNHNISTCDNGPDCWDCLQIVQGIPRDDIDTDPGGDTYEPDTPTEAEYALDTGIEAATTVQRLIPELASGAADLTTIADLDRDIADALRTLRGARRTVRELAEAARR